MRRLVASLTILSAAWLSPAALAQTPAAPVTAAPVQTQMQLKVQRVGGARATTLTGSRVVARGTTAAYVPGQTVVVRFHLRGRKRAVKRVALQPGAGGTGAFAASYRPPRPGTLKVRATHEATPALAALAAAAESVDVIPSRVRRRSGRTSIRSLQRRLKRLGYVTGRSGVFDARTARAVLAFRKVTGMARTTSASKSVMRRIARGGGRFPIRFAKHGRHIEADLSRQVIALIDRGRVRRIYPTSTGKASTPTVLGSYKVYRKDFGTNSLGMVHSAYFHRGYATHGYASVPTYPASHGCLRVPVPDARSLYRWIRLGTRVDVYP